MNIYYRLRQQTLRLCSYFVKWETPIIFEGENVYSDIVNVLDKEKTVFIATDKNIIKFGLIKKLLFTLDKENCSYILYSEIAPNPTISNIEDALSVYHEKGCYQIIAFGGGSVIDCAKVVAARVVKPKQSVKQMHGLLKIKKSIVPIIAIPTTAGTGSETTIAAVVTDDDTHQKYAITDNCLVPRYSAFIPELTQTLPASITATTGLDALTHAIESYIGKSNTKQTKRDALMAIKLIHENLEIAYNNGDDLQARKNMLYASFLAGRAFTRAYIGYVHAIAHSLGGMYNTAHGLANSVVLTVVLREYGEAVYIDLAAISDELELCNIEANNEEKALAVISWIDTLCDKMSIPKIIPEIQAHHIPVLAKSACREANPLYPVPVIFTEKKFRQIFYTLKGEGNE